jgi:hypothetical protein
MWGGYTVRAMLDHMDPADRTAMEAMFQPLPP